MQRQGSYLNVETKCIVYYYQLIIILFTALSSKE